MPISVREVNAESFVGEILEILGAYSGTSFEMSGSRKATFTCTGPR